MRARLLLIAAVLLLAGCGSHTWQPNVEGPYLHGKLQFWLVRPQGKPRAVVILLHGLARNSGEQLVAWQKHLAAQGDAVIFPRYESLAGDPTARLAVVVSSFQAIDQLGNPKAPLVIVGHSRGGRLAVEAAAALQPKLVVAIFPGLLNASFELPTNLSTIPRSTRIYLFSGDKDTDVGTAGVQQLVQRLHAVGRTAQVGVIHSIPGYAATHDSVYETNAAAQRAVWARVDRLIASTVEHAAITKALPAWLTTRPAACFQLDIRVSRNRKFALVRPQVLNGTKEPCVRYASNGYLIMRKVAGRWKLAFQASDPPLCSAGIPRDLIPCRRD